MMRDLTDLPQKGEMVRGFVESSTAIDGLTALSIYHQSHCVLHSMQHCTLVLLSNTYSHKKVPSN